MADETDELRYRPSWPFYLVGSCYGDLHHDRVRPCGGNRLRGTGISAWWRADDRNHDLNCYPRLDSGLRKTAIMTAYLRHYFVRR